MAFVVDTPVLNAGRVGNGRLLVSGISEEGDPAISYRLGGGPYITAIATPEEGANWFWAEGFAEGAAHSLEVRSGATIVHTETVFWPFVTRDLYAEWESLMRPAWLGGSTGWEALMWVFSRHLADLYTLVEDSHAQSDPATATWTLSVWEQMLGIPISENRPYQERREAVRAKRYGGTGYRQRFLEQLALATGSGVAINDFWSQYRIELAYISGGDPQIEGLVQKLIAEMKPVGVIVDTTTGGFIVGINQAGDSL